MKPLMTISALVAGVVITCTACDPASESRFNDDDDIVVIENDGDTARKIRQPNRQKPARPMPNRPRIPRR
jgi:hypothetical protein